MHDISVENLELGCTNGLASVHFICYGHGQLDNKRSLMNLLFVDNLVHIYIFFIYVIWCILVRQKGK